jgi:hypothetical protein
MLTTLPTLQERAEAMRAAGDEFGDAVLALLSESETEVPLRDVWGGTAEKLSERLEHADDQDTLLDELRVVTLSATNDTLVADVQVIVDRYDDVIVYLRMAGYLAVDDTDTQPLDLIELQMPPLEGSKLA